MTSIQAATYPIHFNEKAYNELANVSKSNAYSSIFILVDDHTMEYCYPRFTELFVTDTPIEVIQIAAGEIHKNIETCTRVWQVMTELGADRKSLLIALGGGVITDLAGFVAATFKRGIDFINVPTTLLSMVDASIGGKTGVDLGVLKNQIGVFANPVMIVIDPEYLHTVTPREMKSGLAEIMKYGMTHDLRLFTAIKDHPNLNVVDVIHRSIEIKNEVVLADPTEQHIRKVLNWGHTIGHGIESYCLAHETKETLTHGEAIAMGMVCEAYVSHKVLGFPLPQVTEIKKSVVTIYGKIQLHQEDFKAIIELMKHDKKNIAGEINFVLLKDYENFTINCKVPRPIIEESLQFYIDELA